MPGPRDCPNPTPRQAAVTPPRLFRPVPEPPRTNPLRLIASCPLNPPRLSDACPSLATRLPACPIPSCPRDLSPLRRAAPPIPGDYPTRLKPHRAHASRRVDTPRTLSGRRDQPTLVSSERSAATGRFWSCPPSPTRCDEPTLRASIATGPPYSGPCRCEPCCDMPIRALPSLVTATNRSEPTTARSPATCPPLSRHTHARRCDHPTLCASTPTHRDLPGRSHA